MRKCSLPLLAFITLINLISLQSIGQCSDARFTKFDKNGNELAKDASEWAIVHDSTSGLYWEIKSVSEDIHSQKDTYKYSKAKKNFIKALNQENFGGYNDWRLPTSDELIGLQKKGDQEPFINQNFFPNTVPSLYLSWRLCGSGEIVTEKIKFGRTKIKGKKRHVRAVRGKEPPQ